MRTVLKAITHHFNNKSLTSAAEDLAYLRRHLPEIEREASSKSQAADFLGRHRVYCAAFKAILEQPAALDPMLYHAFKQSMNGSSVFEQDVLAQTKAEIALARSSKVVGDLLNQALEAGQPRAQSRHLKDLNVPLSYSLK